ncbi:MAG: hypothetical protein NTZ94_02680, partial [Verrucomicrobia bacterium]|nr:hypothetical protein [Verrucomicrobiota bacterium]
MPPSLPLMSPYGLPSAGYPASARWHVFAPAQLALRANLRLVYLAPAPALDCQKTPPADICFYLLILKILQ